MQPEAAKKQQKAAKSEKLKPVLPLVFISYF
jgi:hypothetical protein